MAEAWFGTTNRESSLLRWVEFHERGDWLGSDAIVSSHGLKQIDMINCYAQAMIWADAALLVAT